MRPKTITIPVTDEQIQQIKDLRYHCDITQKEIFKAGLLVLKEKITIKLDSVNV